jgi:DNA-binding response OmpR family regulator
MNTKSEKRILLADNLEEYRRSVLGFLMLEGYSVAEAGTPDEAKEKLAQGMFDLVLVDLRMRDDDDINDMSGLEIAMFASKLGLPCIIVTAFPTVELARATLRVQGPGAAPYARDLITKGSGPQALLDSIRLTLDYAETTLEKSVEKGLYVDLDRKLVFKDGVKIELPSRQYKLLAELWKMDGGVCTYAELIKSIYQENRSDLEIGKDTRIKKLVDRTKHKIEDKDSKHQYIETESGRGYRLNRNP